MKRKVLVLIIVLSWIVPRIQAVPRWKISPDGSIVWNIKQDTAHYDHIEMSGELVSTVLRYGVNRDGSFFIERSMVWPMLRTVPNKTHASLMQRFATDFPSLLIVNGLTMNNEEVISIRLDGVLTVTSQYATGKVNVGAARKQDPVPTVELTRVIFPSTDKPMLCERYYLTNISDKDLSVSVPEMRSVHHTDPTKGVDGSYTLITGFAEPGLYTIKPGEQLNLNTYTAAYKNNEPLIQVDFDGEESARRSLVEELWTKLVFNSPDEVLNTAFAFAKIRASESIYKTKGGYMHGPGGESYYAAIWANDQAEYINPLFPFLGYDTGNESALNSFRHFARFMNDEFRPIPSSIIAEGIDIWNGAGDRGDAAMIAYGAARYALARGDKRQANELWPLIEWCLEYCKRKLTSEGVVASDSDELEGRFPAGDANLCTSSLYYDALLSSSYLAAETGKPRSVANRYRREAEALKKAIEAHFGANVEGFDTYQYYDGNDILRSWICIPLTVGIFERKEGTIDALFSPRLWSRDGLLTQAGTSTFWDRSTLYALRGVYAAGARERATQYLNYYSSQRLLGDHVPYPIEAWPEGSQRHLSAESGLYCRIITEGLFGIRPIGLDKFQLTPQLPDQWDYMELNNINAFAGQPFDIHIVRNGPKIISTIIRDNKIIGKFSSRPGETLTVKL